MKQVIALLLMSLFTLASCHRGTWHLVQPEVHPAHIAPRVAPEPTATVSLMPTITPEPSR